MDNAHYIRSILTNKCQLRKKTVDSYITSYNKIMKICCFKDIKHLVTRKQFVFNAIDNMENQDSARTILTGIVKIIFNVLCVDDKGKQEYREFLIGKTEEQKLRQKKKVYTKEEKAEAFQISSLKTLLKQNAQKLFKDNTNTYLWLEHVVLTAFYYQPTMRLQNYSNVYLEMEDRTDGKNYINIMDGNLYLYDFKTQNSIGNKIIELHPKVARSIRNCYKYVKNDYWFFSPKNPKNSLQLSNIYKKIKSLHPGLNIQKIRKAYITYCKDELKYDTKQMEELANKYMLHSPETQREIYYMKEKESESALTKELKEMLKTYKKEEIIIALMKV
jgi:hypothetical protein